MADTEVVWNGVTLGGDSAYGILSISGWEDLPGVTDYSTARVRGHGDHQGALYSQARIVTVTGEIVDSDGRNGLSQALEAATLLDGTLADLTIDLLGRPLTAKARVTQRALTIGQAYDWGAVPFAVQWKCSDPLRYGPVRAAVSTGLPTSSGGLVYGVAYPLTYGTTGATGRLTLTNDGTAPAPIVATITGSLPSGFEISSGGQRLRYETTVPSGQTLTLDTAAGTLFAEGVADRRANLTVADWIQVPPLSTITLQFSSLGGAYDAAATLTVPGFRSASW